MRHAPLACGRRAALVALTIPGVALASQSGPDWVSSDNVEYLGSLKQDIGLTTGAKVVGDRLFVTSNITIYDISKPETPQTLGSMHCERRVGERGGPDQRRSDR